MAGLLRYAVPSALLEEQLRKAEAERRERIAARAAAAEALGLPWPRPAGPRLAGRPSRQQLYEDELYSLIRRDALPVDATRLAPNWWRPGCSVTRSSEDQAAEMQAAPPLVASRSADTPVAAPSTGDQPAGAPAKRQRITLPRSVVNWLLGYADLQKLRWGWDRNRPLRAAAALAPELFGHVDVSVPRRWKRTEEPITSSTGRPPDVL